MKKCQLKKLFGQGYTCERNCKYYGSIACKTHKDCIKGQPYKCPYFNPTYGTLTNEVAELQELIDDWNF